MHTAHVFKEQNRHNQDSKRTSKFSQIPLGVGEPVFFICLQTKSWVCWSFCFWHENTKSSRIRNLIIFDSFVALLLFCFRLKVSHPPSYHPRHVYPTFYLCCVPLDNEWVSDSLLNHSCYGAAANFQHDSLQPLRKRDTQNELCSDYQWAFFLFSCMGNKHFPKVMRGERSFLIVDAQKLNPKCVVTISAVKCSGLAAPSDGHMHGSDFTYGAVVRFSCFRGFQLIGSQARKCQTDGVWSGTTASCTSKITSETLFRMTFPINVYNTWGVLAQKVTFRLWFFRE